MDRQKLIDEARKWLGVPFRHEGRSLTGVDCYGLLIVVGRICNIKVPIETGYGKRPSGLHMKNRLHEYATPVSLNEIEPGDILHMKFQNEPQHLAIVTGIDPLMILHADGLVGKVVEHRVDERWRKMIRGVYRIDLDG